MKLQNVPFLDFDKNSALPSPDRGIINHNSTGNSPGALRYIRLLEDEKV